MRQYVEFVYEQDLVWRPSDTPFAVPSAKQRLLSSDEETGARTSIFEFSEDASMSPSGLGGDCELFVLVGRMELGEHALTDGAYARIRRGVPFPPVVASAGTRVLCFVDDISGSTASPPPLGADEPVVVLDTANMEWVEGEADPPSGPLFSKMLREDSDGGPTTRLLLGPPGWRDDRFDVHPNVEEAFTLSGSCEYNFGSLFAGSYFYRPPWIYHGAFVPNEETGVVWLLRTDKAPSTYHVEGRTVTASERRIYPARAGMDPFSGRIPVAGYPVRSASAGPWDQLSL